MEKISIKTTEKVDSGRFARHDLLGGWWSQDKLARSHVLIVGVGALGNEIVKNLAMFGVGKITIVDYDWIEESNLNRCVLFTEDDVLGDKVYKVDAVARNVARINSKMVVNTLKEDVHAIVRDDPDFFKQFDVVALALDNWPARISVGNLAYDYGVPVVNGGMRAFDGTVFVAIPPETPCVECLLPASTKAAIMKVVYSCTTKGEIIYDGFDYIKVPTITTTNSVIGALQSQEIIFLLHGFSQYKETGIWPIEVPKPLWGQKAEFYGRTHNLIVYDATINDACEYHNSLKMLDTSFVSDIPTVLTVIIDGEKVELELEADGDDGAYTVADIVATLKAANFAINNLYCGGKLLADTMAISEITAIVLEAS